MITGINIIFEFKDSKKQYYAKRIALTEDIEGRKLVHWIDLENAYNWRFISNEEYQYIAEQIKQQSN